MADPAPGKFVAVEPPQRPRYLPAREELAQRYLIGEGLEIGALNRPLAVPARVRVRQVDRMTVEALKRHYPEMRDLPLAPVDIVDDGETLATVATESQDFVIANHFLEHTGDPIGTIGAHLDKLKRGGILFYAVPDQRYSFDFRRPLTSLDHMIRDHEEGPETSRRQHFDEWTRFVAATDDERAAEGFAELAESRARQIEAADYSIHTHVWTQASFLSLLLCCRERFDEAFEIEAIAQNGPEIVAILRRGGSWPAAPDPDATVADLRRELAARDRQIGELEQELRATATALTAVQTSPSWRLTRPLRTLKARLGKS